MSLRVHDDRSRSRARSKSRERSRHGRAPSAVREKPVRTKKAYDSDSFDEDRIRYPAVGRSSSSKYRDYSPAAAPAPAPTAVDEASYRRRRGYDQYYISDDEVPALGSRYRRPSRSRTREKKVPLYDSESDLEAHAVARAVRASRPLSYASRHEEADLYYSDSDEYDEDLAYGDPYYDRLAPKGSRVRSRSASRVRPPGHSTKPAQKFYDSDSSSHGYARDYRKGDPLGRTKDQYHGYGGHGGHGEKRAPEPKTEHHRSGSRKESPIDLNAWAEVPECEQPGYVPSQMQQHGPGAGVGGYQQEAPNHPAAGSASYSRPMPGPIPGNGNPIAQYPVVPQSTYVPQKYGNNAAANHTTGSAHHRGFSTESVQSPPRQQTNTQPQAFHQYTTSTGTQDIKYTSKTAMNDKIKYSAKPVIDAKVPAQYVEIKPGRRSVSGRPSNMNLSTGEENMRIPGGFPESNKPPSSPLLEPYLGTYQSMSPMPWPKSLGDDDISDFEQLEGRRTPGLGRKKSKKDKESKKAEKAKAKAERPKPKPSVEHVTAASTSNGRMLYRYDAKEDAKTIKSAMLHSRVDTKSLTRILPYLTSEEILILRAEYKNQCKMSGKGVNIAKHIKVQVPGNFGKVCYATALGRWESEAHWANFWYQSNRTRNELLIESLVGRPNSEIREIKKSFSDKRYADNLERCMKAELKADKFRMAILLALEERRQDDNSPLNIDLIHRDVQSLHQALVSHEGGETAMIHIIVVRGQNHLREVLHVYENMYHQNFAKLMISKSRNLVGETLAHILNGVLNRPVRDALLIHQAIAESGTGRDRAELLISRLVRMHWEPQHLEQVKYQYRQRYRTHIEDHIEEQIIEAGGDGKKTEWAEFCIELVKSSAVHVESGSH